MSPRLSIVTGIDLPLEPSCGSMILCSDMYRQMTARFRTTFLALPPASPAWQHGFDQTVLCEAAKEPYGPGFCGYVDKLTAEVRRLLDARPADVIHAQHLGFGLALALARAARDVPVIAIAHGTDVIAAGESELGRATLTEIVARATTVVAPSAALASRIEDLSGGRYRDRITLMPWGIPLRQVLPAPHPATGRRPLRLLHAGRLDANKSTITAIDALARTGGEHELTVIGSGPELQILQDRAGTLGLGARCRFIPFQPRHRLWDQFRNFDAFLFTTAGLEAFGLVAIEAQAHGVPVIYAAIPGMNTTLGGAGLAYAPGDPGDLASAIDRLAASPALHRDLSSAGSANAARYDIEDTASLLASLTLRATGKAA